MPRADFKFIHRIRVRYSEIDGQAVVFNARYLDYADLAVVEFFRAVGIPTVPGPSNPEFHAARAEVDYKAPIRLDEEVDIAVRITRIGRTSVTFAIEMHGAGREDLRAIVGLVYVHVDLKNGRPTPLPPTLIAKFEDYAGTRLVAA